MRFIIGAAVGAALGLGYYKLVGGPTGTCPLTRNLWITSIYGVLIAGSSR